jgi:hypothetical protein
VLSHLIERFLPLDPPLTRDLAVRRDLRVPMPDGAVLLADLWAPRISTASLPVALLRSPYGRRGLIGSGLARPLAERGFPQATDSALTLEFLRPDGLSLETPFAWGVMVAGQERRGALLRTLAQERRNRRALDTLPLSQADAAAAGHQIGYVQDILARDAADPRWAGIDHTHRVADVTVSASATRLVAADQEVYHGPERPSAVILPVRAARS